MVVPARRADPGAVATGIRQPLGAPRCPRRGHLDPGQLARQRVVAAHRRERLGVERRRVVGTADDGDSLAAVAHLGADHLAHEGLPPGVVVDLEVSADPPHGLSQVGEVRERRRATVLDGVLPPALRVVVAGGRRQGGDRVDTRPPPPRRPLRLVIGELVGRGQVGEAGIDAVAERPAQGHPLGGEDGERVEGRPPRLVDGIDEPGHRRHEVRVGGQRDQRVELGRTLDDDDVGLQLVERTRDRACGAGSVVPDAQHLHLRHVSPARGTRGRGRSTRRGP